MESRRTKLQKPHLQPAGVIEHLTLPVRHRRRPSCHSWSVSSCACTAGCPVCAPPPLSAKSAPPTHPVAASFGQTGAVDTQISTLKIKNTVKKRKRLEMVQEGNTKEFCCWSWLEAIYQQTEKRSINNLWQWKTFKQFQWPIIREIWHCVTCKTAALYWSGSSHLEPTPHFSPSFYYLWRFF